MRAERLGESKLTKIKETLKVVLDDNKIDLPEDLLNKMPPVPDVSKASTIPLTMENIEVMEHLQFSSCQVIKTETSFCHVGIALNIMNLPEKLRPYLVIFQELIFQSPLCLITSSSESMMMEYQEVSKYCSDLFISHECGVGFGNALFSVSYLSQVLTMFATFSPEDWERAVRFLAQAIMFSVFTKDRILTIAKNLLSNLTDTKRDGNAVLGAVLNRVSLSPAFAARTGNCENQISIFEQELFLKTVIRGCKVCCFVFDYTRAEMAKKSFNL